MTPDLAELRRLYEAAMCVDANEMAWDEWTTAISEAADALLDAAAERDALAADADKWQRAALTLQRDRDALTDERDSLSWQVEALRAERDARSSERDALAAKVERVRELHKSSGDAETQGYTGREYGYISPYCMGEVASDEYGVPWPCETIRAIDGAES